MAYIMYIILSLLCWNWFWPRLLLNLRRLLRTILLLKSLSNCTTVILTTSYVHYSLSFDCHPNKLTITFRGSCTFSLFVIFMFFWVCSLRNIFVKMLIRLLCDWLDLLLMGLILYKLHQLSRLSILLTNWMSFVLLVLIIERLMKLLRDVSMIIRLYSSLVISRWRTKPPFSIISLTHGIIIIIFTNNIISN